MNLRATLAECKVAAMTEIKKTVNAWVACSNGLRGDLPVSIEWVENSPYVQITIGGELEWEVPVLLFAEMLAGGKANGHEIHLILDDENIFVGLNGAEKSVILTFDNEEVLETIQEICDSCGDLEDIFDIDNLLAELLK